jgi:hypothetical protein
MAKVNSSVSVICDGCGTTVNAETKYLKNKKTGVSGHWCQGCYNDGPKAIPATLPPAKGTYKVIPADQAIS